MAKEKSPAFQFYPKDYLSDVNVMALSWSQRGVYIHLLAICWLEDSIPDDSAALARTINAEVADIDAVLELFDTRPGKCRKHNRLDRERKAQASRRKDKSRAGKLGAKARWQRHDPAIALPLANDSSSSATASATTSQEKKTIPQPVSFDYLPCPNCGAEDPMRLAQNTGYGAVSSAWVSCGHCDCSGPTASTDLGALNAWNEMDRLDTGTEGGGAHASTKEGGDALASDDGSTIRGKKEILTGGGSQDEAGPPPANDGIITGAVFGPRALSADEVQQLYDAGPPPESSKCSLCGEPLSRSGGYHECNTDSHEQGQPSRGARGTRKADEGAVHQTPSAEAAPARENQVSTDGAGEGSQANARELTPPERGPAPTPPDASEEADYSDTDEGLRFSRGRDGPGGPTEDTLDNDDPGYPPGAGSHGPTEEPLFADWYATYPRKVAKADARKAWGKLSLKRQRALWETWPQWRTEFEGRASDFVPYPASFIREMAWEEPPPPAKGGARSAAAELEEL